MFSTVSHSTFASALLMNSSAVHAASPMNCHLWWHSSQGKIPSKMVRRCLWISNMYTGVVIIISSSFQLVCSVSASTLYSQCPVDCRCVAPDTFFSLFLRAVNMWSTVKARLFQTESVERCALRFQGFSTECRVSVWVMVEAEGPPIWGSMTALQGFLVVNHIDIDDMAHVWGGWKF